LVKVKKGKKPGLARDYKELCPEIGKVFFHKIRAGMGNVYFG
jgi:hypothetical protein